MSSCKILHPEVKVARGILDLRWLLELLSAASLYSRWIDETELELLHKTLAKKKFSHSNPQVSGSDGAHCLDNYVVFGSSMWLIQLTTALGVVIKLLQELPFKATILYLPSFLGIGSGYRSFKFSFSTRSRSLSYSAICKLIKSPQLFLAWR